MTGFNVGDMVLIPVEVADGPFPNEKFVQIQQGGDGEEKILSGFVPERFVISKGGKSFVRGEIIDSRDDSILVKVPGSFFTAAHGRTFFSNKWAEKHFQLAVAA